MIIDNSRHSALSQASTMKHNKPQSRRSKIRSASAATTPSCRIPLFAATYLVVASFPNSASAFPVIILQTGQSSVHHDPSSITCLQAATSPIHTSPGRTRISSTKLGYRDSNDLQSPDSLHTISPAVEINVEMYNASIVENEEVTLVVGEVYDDVSGSDPQMNNDDVNVHDDDSNDSSPDCSRIHKWWNAIISKAASSAEESHNESHFESPNSQVRLDDYLESIDRRYKRLHHNELPVPTTAMPGFTSAWKWLKQGYSDGSEPQAHSTKDPKEEDALYVLGLAELASADLLQKHHLPVPEAKIKLQKQYRRQKKVAAHVVKKSQQKRFTIIDVPSILAADAYNSNGTNNVVPSLQLSSPNPRLEAMQQLHYMILRAFSIVSLRTRGRCYGIARACGNAFTKCASRAVQHGGSILGSKLPFQFTHWAFVTMITYISTTRKSTIDLDES